MTRFDIPLTRLAGPAPTTLVVPASELAIRFDADAILAQARRQAQALHDSASEAVAKAAMEAEAIRAQAREQGLAQARSDIDAERAALVERAVAWHVEETRIEAVVCARLESRIRGLVAEALEAFAGACDATEVLMPRILQALSRPSMGAAVTLHVARAALADAVAACAHYPALRVIADADLQATQAVLETPLVRIHIDTAQHLQSVLARLRETQEQEFTDGRENH